MSNYGKKFVFSRVGFTQSFFTLFQFLFHNFSIYNDTSLFNKRFNVPAICKVSFSKGKEMQNGIKVFIFVDANCIYLINPQEFFYCICSPCRKLCSTKMSEATFEKRSFAGFIFY